MQLLTFFFFFVGCESFICPRTTYQIEAGGTGKVCDKEDPDWR